MPGLQAKTGLCRKMDFYGEADVTLVYFEKGEMMVLMSIR